MDNASKNAGDMIGRLQMQYNRGRQASITNELVDIITGSWLYPQFVRGIADPCTRCQCLVISENSLQSGIDPVALYCDFAFPNRCPDLVPSKRGVLLQFPAWFANPTFAVYFGVSGTSALFLRCMDDRIEVPREVIQLY